MLCAHWRPTVPDYLLTGDAVHLIARTTPGLAPLAHYSDEDMLIDVFIATNGLPMSVAHSDGTC